MIIGLTGESGAGKSTVAKFLEMSGFYIVDCDGISRTLDTDKEYVAQVEGAFGAEAVFFSGGGKRINRKALGNMLFGTDAASGSVEKLNAISHPIIISKVHAEIAHATEFGRSVIIDAPLLFESGLHKICDVTVGVIAPVEMRIARLCARDGISEDMARKRFEKQKDDAFLRANCTYIIANDSGSEALASRVLAITEKLMKGLK